MTLLNTGGLHLVSQPNEKTEVHPLVDVGFVLDLKPTLMTLDFLSLHIPVGQFCPLEHLWKALTYTGLSGRTSHFSVPQESNSHCGCGYPG